MKKAFTIVELLVAVALLAMLMAISSLVFAAAVKAYRTAGAANEIAAKLQVMTQQLDDDLRGLRKEGEFVVVWVPSPVRNSDGTIPDTNGDNYADRYISFDRLMFFADGNFQSYDEQPTSSGSSMVYGNLARICYSFGKDENNTRAWDELNPAKRILCRTQHIYATTAANNALLANFPTNSEWDTTAWADSVFQDFSNENFANEYQTMTMEDWTDKILVGDSSGNHPIKDNMLSIILDLPVGKSPVTQSLLDTYGGPMVNTNQVQTLHHLFMQGVGQFHVQIWWVAGNRWWPEIDPNGDGLYTTDSDYYVDLDGDGYTDESLYLGPGVKNVRGSRTEGQYVGSALKFTFTLYDSNGVFKDGKTFTHIVYLND